ncbi:MAG: hypothetical protein AAFV93_20420, partial [Chloroflexota bacterium]
LTFWFGATVYLSLNNLLTDFTVLPPPMAIAMTIPVMIGLWMLFRVETFQRIMMRLPLYGIIGIQMYRVLGAVFLLAWFNDEMASALSLTTGIMDVTVGLLAAFILAFRINNRALLIGWNILGLADFAYSVTLSLFAAPTVIQVIDLHGVELLAQQPLSLISLWAVPLSILLHSVALYQLTQSKSSVITQGVLTI